MRHVMYLKYLMRHKWFVLLAGLKVGASLWRLLAHDLSKFRPSEWLPYARTFYTPRGGKCYEPSEAFDLAWLSHQHANKHHWQHWVLLEDSGVIKLLDMPPEYIQEMVADWAGAGRAITGRWDVAKWYLANAPKIEMSLNTRFRVEVLLKNHFGFVVTNFCLGCGCSLHWESPTLATCLGNCGWSKDTGETVNLEEL